MEGIRGVCLCLYNERSSLFPLCNLALDQYLLFSTPSFFPSSFSSPRSSSRCCCYFCYFSSSSTSSSSSSSSAAAVSAAFL